MTGRQLEGPHATQCRDVIMAWTPSLHGKVREYPVVKNGSNPYFCQAISIQSFNKLKAASGEWIDIYNYITAKSGAELWHIY
jgi:hypothetical protein